MADEGTSSKSKSRQKIESKKMENEASLQVTFSKHRSSLFKKASELCTLCRPDVGLIVFSPGNRAFCYGNPNIDIVIDRFLSIDVRPARDPHNDNDTQQTISRINEVLATYL